MTPGLVVSRNQDTVVTTTWQNGPGGWAVGSLLRVWSVRADRVEDRALGPTGFFWIAPWPEDRFAVIWGEEERPDASEADALPAQAKARRVSIRHIHDPLNEIAGVDFTSDGRQELEGNPSPWDVPASLVPLGFPLVLRVDGGDVTMHRIGVVPASPARGDGDGYRLTTLGDGRTVLVSHTR